MVPPVASSLSVLYTLLLLQSANDREQANDPAHPKPFNTVMTKHGAVRGKLDYSFFEQTPFYAYRGVPYAKPPLGPLRFKATEPVEDWAPNVLDATEFAKVCWVVPRLYYTQSEAMDEDCLKANIYVPVTTDPEPMPVLLHTIGGSFIANSANDYLSGPDFLMDRKVILVSFNYRLGVFGYLNMDTRDMSGNMGMKDQQMAIEWVHKNIASFGGDPKRITLVGHSSGGISVNYQVLNPRSRSFLRGAIPMSGSAFIHSAYHNGNHRCFAELLAKNASFPVNNEEDLMRYLATAKATQMQYFVNDNFNLLTAGLSLPFAPVVERKDAIRPFMTDTPAQIARDTPFINTAAMVTFTSAEDLNYEDKDTLQPDVVARDLEVAQFPLPIHEFNSTYAARPYLQDVMHELRDYYIQNATEYNETSYRIVKLRSYLEFVYGIEQNLRWQTEKSRQDTFYLKFSALGSLRGFKGQKKYDETPVKGAAHVEDLCYVYRCVGYQFDYDKIAATKDTDPSSALSLEIIRNITTLYANFARYQDPGFGFVDGFIPAKPNEYNYGDLTNDGVFPGRNPNDMQIEEMDYIVAKATDLLVRYETQSPSTEFELTCKRIEDHQRSIANGT